ncbi:MAG: 2'-5' RNA ligase family protein [Candidatus Heimdallarchaeota archaeon]
MKFGKLKTIAQHIESLSDSFNFKKEKREFKAHLTIGRLKRIKDKYQLVEVIQSYKETTFGSLKVTKFKLKKSELTPQGPIYSTLFEVKGTE